MKAADGREGEGEGEGAGAGAEENGMESKDEMMDLLVLRKREVGPVEEERGDG